VAYDGFVGSNFDLAQNAENSTMNRRTLSGILCAFIFAVAPFAACGQSKLDPGMLPKSTAFYVAWHGTPSSEARKANSLLALWDDPGFAPVRNAMFESMLPGSASSQKTTVTREELSEYASLLDNEFVLGYIENPNAMKATVSATDAQPHRWNGMFFVYDREGKETTIAKLLVRARASEKGAPQISTTTIAGIPVIKAAGATSTTYWAEEGKYAITASEPKVFEQIVGWTKHFASEARTTNEAEALGKTGAYHEAVNLLQGGVLEFFAHFPSIEKTDWDTSAGGFRLRPLLQSLKLEAVHVIAGHLVLDGARMRMQGAILGEVKPGTLFDLWDEGTTTPATWQFINSNTVSYQESRVNFQGIYDLIKHALQATAGAGQKNPMDMMETAAATRLGMPVATALGLFSGEMASLQTSATLDPHKQLYIFGIRNKPEVLKVLRGALAERVASERTEGATTFVKISEGGMASNAGTAAWNYYHLGVTGDVIVASDRLESVRDALAQRKSAAAENSQVPQAWQAARAQFPAKIEGINIFDFQRIDWAAAKERWATEARKAAAKANQKSPAEKNPSPFGKALENLDPQIFSRHLHLSASAGWKDAQGVHFEGWIE
jgi:hypothetical protein